MSTIPEPTKPRKAILAGYKTYIVATITIVGAVGAYLAGLDGSPSLPELAQLVVTALLGVTIRNGIK